MTELQDRLVTFINDRGQGDTVRLASEVLFTDMPRSLADSLVGGVRPALAQISVALASGDEGAAIWALTRLVMSGAANGYAFREWEFERAVREEIVG